MVALRNQLRKTGDFPHEIGLFVGYPPEDVDGFIRLGPEKCKCTGLWKVYGDDVQAKKTFAKYKKCTSIYCEMVARGKTLEQLTVAV